MGMVAPRHIRSAQHHPEGVSMFEPMGGSAPKYTGKNVINPLATICAGGMMMDTWANGRWLRPSTRPCTSPGFQADQEPGCRKMAWDHPGG